MIECTLMEMKKYSFTTSDDKRVKYGRYLNSLFNIPGYGKKYWVVGVNIDLDYDKYEKEDFTLEEIVRRCVEHLNTPPPRRYKRGRKRTIPKYGFFNSEPYRFYLKEDGDKKYIQALLLVENRKRRYFWGKGRTDIWKRRKKCKKSST